MALTVKEVQVFNLMIDLIKEREDLENNVCRLVNKIDALEIDIENLKKKLDENTLFDNKAEGLAKT